MATVLTQSATDSVAQQGINDKWKQKVKEADGAGYLSSPEAASVREKIIPFSPEPASLHLEIVPSKPATLTPSSRLLPAKAIEPSPVIINVSDPLEFISHHLDARMVRPEHVEESAIEKQIIQAVTRKTEEILEKRKKDRELGLVLEERIRDRQSLMVQLQADMRRKVKHIESKKDALEQFRIDFAEQVKQQVPSSSTVQKSSLNRMQEEKEKKRLLSEWKNNNSDDTLQQLRKTILTSQDEVNLLNNKIVNLRNELAILQQIAESSVSSNYIMAELREKREQDKMMGIPRRSADAKPPAPPAPPVIRYHLTRMQEEKERKIQARAARLDASSSNYSYACSPSNFASSSSRTTQAM